MFAFLLASGFWLLVPFSYAEIIDRVVAVVGGRIITLSDVRQEREIRRMLGEQPINDDAALIKELVERALIETQMADFPGIEVTEEEVDVELRKPEDRTTAPARMRDAIRTRLRMAKYFEVRFRQFIRASDDEVRKYYEEVLIPEAKNRGVTAIPALEQVADAVRKNVIEEKLNHDVDNWLESVRRRSDVEIFE